MSENPSDQEPSIEEILSSIRQIISDDDEESTDSEVEEETVADPIHHERDDVLELTEDDLDADNEEDEPEEATIDDDAPIEIDMRDRIDEELENIRSAIDDEPEIKEEEPDMSEEEEQPPARPVPSEILSSGAQSAALGSLNKLTSKMPIHSSRSYDGVTLEDIVREMLHPMMREWMDDNLPPMVERIVQKEIEKLARRAMDDY